MNATRVRGFARLVIGASLVVGGCAHQAVMARGDLARSSSVRVDEGAAREGEDLASSARRARPAGRNSMPSSARGARSLRDPAARGALRGGAVAVGEGRVLRAEAEREALAVLEVASHELARMAEHVDEAGGDLPVKSLALRGANDLAGAVAALRSTARQHAVTPRAGALSRTLGDELACTRARLAGLEGAALDHAYVNAQATLYRRLLDVLERGVFPAMQVPVLRDEIAFRVRETMPGQLARLERLRARDEQRAHLAYRARLARIDASLRRHP